MALITCKDCKKEFSTDAKSCPHCGANKPPGASQKLTGLLVLGLIGYLGYAYYLDESARPARKMAEEAADRKMAKAMNISYDDYKLGKANEIKARSACRGAVEQVAKWGAESDWVPNGSWTIHDKVMTVRAHDIRVKNGFGASAYVAYTCSYDTGSGTASVLSVKDY